MLSLFKDEVNKPYYFFRPSQILLRLKRKLVGYKPSSTCETVILPWGIPIRVRPSDMIGSAIFRAGVYDLCVSEVLWRLLDQAETAVDAGANIGHMTSIMAKRVAKNGRVLSFEPHPQVFQELSANVSVWQTVPNIGKIEIYEVGLSNEVGVASLQTTSEFTMNRGTASLEIDNNIGAEEGITHSVSIERLENIVHSNISIGVMKLDVEGHEIDLLQGACSLLTEHRVRDIVFEEKNFYPSPVTDCLEQFGYTIFRIKQGPFAVRVSPAKRDESHYKYEAQSYLATLDASRALERLSKWGYLSLQTDGNDSGINMLSRITIGLVLLLATWLLISKAKK